MNKYFTHGISIASTGQYLAVEPNNFWLYCTAYSNYSLNHHFTLIPVDPEASSYYIYSNYTGLYLTRDESDSSIVGAPWLSHPFQFIYSDIDDTFIVTGDNDAHGQLFWTLDGDGNIYEREVWTDLKIVAFSNPITGQ